MRKIPKWNLPIGSIIIVDGRMNYEFRVVK